MKYLPLDVKQRSINNQSIKSPLYSQYVNIDLNLSTYFINENSLNTVNVCLAIINQSIYFLVCFNSKKKSFYIGNGLFIVDLVCKKFLVTFLKVSFVVLFFIMYCVYTLLYIVLFI